MILPGLVAHGTGRDSALSARPGALVVGSTAAAMGAVAQARSSTRVADQAVPVIYRVGGVRRESHCGTA